MLIGIMSDSHGRHRAVREAMHLFQRLGVEHVIHCGDVGGEEVFDVLAGTPCTYVWGNMDFPDPGLEVMLREIGLPPPKETPARLVLAGKSFAVFHGHEPGFQRACRASSYDYILHGHTHVPRDERRGRTRVINPGALHRAPRKTVATLDIATDTLTLHEIVT